MLPKEWEDGQMREAGWYPRVGSKVHWKAQTQYYIKRREGMGALVNKPQRMKCKVGNAPAWSRVSLAKGGMGVKNAFT